MGIESATYINQLVNTNPVGGVDFYSTADDHLRLLKAVLLNSFPNIGGAVTVAHGVLNGVQNADNLTSGTVADARHSSNIPLKNGANIFTANQTISLANPVGILKDTSGGAADMTAFWSFRDNADVERGWVGFGLGTTQMSFKNTISGGVISIETAGGGAVNINGTSVNNTAILTAGTLADARVAQSNVTQHQAALTIGVGQLSGTLPVTSGGTGATTASGARTNLGLIIGSDVQAFNARLVDVSVVGTTADNFLAGNGANLVLKTPAQARTSLGLGSLATASTINGSNWSGTDLAVADGGTGASDAATARSNLSAAAASHTHAVGDITGTLPLGNGGTGQTTQLGITREVTKAWTIQSDPGGTPSGTAGDVFAYY